MPTPWRKVERERESKKDNAVNSGHLVLPAMHSTWIKPMGIEDHPITTMTTTTTPQKKALEGNLGS